MGVRGLTTFISNRSNQYLENYELHDSYLVLDGNSIASQLYKWHSKCNDCFGGDYDKYANVIKTFFQLLSDCNITPLIVFDGAYEQRKLKTVYSRMKNKISAARDLNSLTENSVSVFPLFLREVFVDIILKLGLKCIRCDFEGDSEAAMLARNLGCPLLSYDSDFYIYDVLYIPFSTMDLSLRRKKKYKYIQCQMYNVEKFLNSFGGLNKQNLPLLAVLLGNDYVKKRIFSPFFQHLKVQKCKNANEQQRLIKSIIMWLKNETPETALIKILGRYKLKRRKKIAEKIQQAIEAYQSTKSNILDFFNINANSVKMTSIEVPKPEDVEDLELEEEEEEDETMEVEDSEDEEDEIEEDEDSVKDPELKIELPESFRDNYKKCLYPSAFMDIVVCNTYYCIPQVEVDTTDHAHTISLNILAAINDILNKTSPKPLMCVSRGNSKNIKKTTLPQFEKPLPSLEELQNMTILNKKTILLEVLGIKNGDLDQFPDYWHLFVLSIKYWINNSKTKIDLPYLYSTILCAIVLNYVDKNLGFYRSTKAFLTKFPQIPDIDNNNSFQFENTIIETLNQINATNSVSCLHKLINYFQMDVKMKSNARLFDRAIVHDYSQFQSCLLHIKYLNAVLGFPFVPLSICDFYDGTFLYNMTGNLQKRTDVKSYIKILLEKCPIVLNSFQLIVDEIEKDFEDGLGNSVGVKRRKKKRKPKEVKVEDLVVEDSEEEYEFDENNAFSLLSFINKDL